MGRPESQGFTRLGDWGSGSNGHKASGLGSHLGQNFVSQGIWPGKPWEAILGKISCHKASGPGSHGKPPWAKFRVTRHLAWEAMGSHLGQNFVSQGIWPGKPWE